MGYTTLDKQCRLAAYGFDPGPIDGAMGPMTRRAKRAFHDATGHPIEHDFHRSGLHRIIWHWTGGTHKASSTDKKHYHFIIEGDGNVVPGENEPEDNTDAMDGIYGAHVWKLNTGSIGIACAAMAGAQEVSFSWGDFPLTEKQIDQMLLVTRGLCQDYNIPISPWTVLMHSEVQPNLNVRQRQKWDLNVMPGDVKTRNARTIGDELRMRI
ncbi:MULTISPECIES: N-acetylmuramoyl-L-alanine amidase [unclassified Roseobacter]|uniref:peptidoglycan recognition protein family protein n=1 Tax=unclassified Roseobacter TaxID=196798 RepID=UPI001491820B|nr:MULTISPECIES: N-acetylmuramoyl-L-alanine amidase [unclassified Roseobacter]NNW55497.1 lysis protein [Roseobacter sp. HKCCD8284]NNY17316.1 lysis protein [Roseobacter sp. HKCCD8191]